MAKYAYVNNDNDVLSTDSVEDATRYASMGYRKATFSDIQTDQVKQQFAGGWNGLGAAALGAVEAIPGGSWLADQIQGPQQVLPGTDTPVGHINTTTGMSLAHPTATTAGQMLGGAAMFATGEGALVDAGMEGASLVANASRAGIVNAALGTENRLENAALQYATTDPGTEHLWQDVGIGALTDAAIGAGVGVAGAGVTGAVKGASKALRAMGSVADTIATPEARQAILDMGKINEGLQSARKTEMGQVFEEMGYHKMEAAQVKADIKERLPELEAQFDAIKGDMPAPLPANQIGMLADNVGNYFADPILQKDGIEIVDAITGAESLNVESLHALRNSIDAKIDFGAEIPSARDKALWGARTEVSKALQNTLRANDLITGGVRAEQWVNADRMFANLSAIDKVVTTAPTKFEGLLGSSKNIRPFFNMLRFVGGVTGTRSLFTGAEAMYRGIQMASKMQTPEYRAAAKTVAGFLNKNADRMAKVVSSGLYGAAHVAAVQLVNATVSPDHFDQLYGKSQWIMQNEQLATSNIAAHLQDTGVDTETGQKLTTRAVQMQKYMATAIPPNPQTNSILPTHAYIPETSKAEWIDNYRVMEDPAHALANPTNRNITFMRTFYPEQYRQASSAIIQQLQNNPDLPIEGQMWASRVLQCPVGPSVGSRMYSMIQAGRAAEAQAQQQAQAQAAQSSKRGNSGAATLDSNSTTLQRLQGES